MTHVTKGNEPRGSHATARAELPQYPLKDDHAEARRLDAQAQLLAHPTELLLRSAGIRTGMTVLDLGTGLGHVAFAAAALVGPTGNVTGIDQAPRLLEIADQRRARAGLDNVHFQLADVRTFQAPGPLDAVIGRLILFHLPDAIDVIRHHTRTLAPGGRMIALDYDAGAVRAEPGVLLLAQTVARITAAFAATGGNPVIGARLGPLLRTAGLTDVRTFGIQPYLGSNDPSGPALIADVARSLAPTILAHGIATENELQLDTLQQRLAAAAQAVDAVILPPTLVGAWGRRPPCPHM